MSEGRVGTGTGTASLAGGELGRQEMTLSRNRSGTGGLMLWLVELELHVSSMRVLHSCLAHEARVRQVFRLVLQVISQASRRLGRPQQFARRKTKQQRLGDNVRL